MRADASVWPLGCPGDVSEEAIWPTLRVDGTIQRASVAICRLSAVGAGLLR